MKNIDELFNEQLNANGLPYKEDYWNQMETMLNEKKKKKRGFFWSHTAAFVLGALVTASVAYALLSASETSSPFALHTVMNTIEITGLKTPDNPSEQPPVLHQSETIIGKQNVFHTPTEKSFSNNKQNTSYTPVSPNAISEKPNPETTEYFIEKPAIVSETIQPENTITPQVPALAVNDFALPIVFTIDPMGLYRTSFPNVNKDIFEPLATPAHKHLSDTTQLKKKPLDPDYNKWTLWLAPSYQRDFYLAYNNGRYNEEKNLNSTGFNLNMIAAKKGWRFKSGLGYMQLNTRTNYSSETRTYSFDTSYAMIERNYGQTPAGKPLALIKRRIDTTTTVNTFIKNPNALANISYLKIPLTAAYTFGNAQWGLFVETGFNLAIRMQSKGEYTTYNGSTYEPRDMKTSGDIRPMLLQANAAFGLRYRIVKGINISGSYGFNRSLNSVTRSYQRLPALNYYQLGFEFRLK